MIRSRAPLLTALSVAVAASAAAAAPAPPLTLEEATRLTAELIPRVEELRGRAFKRPVPVKMVSDAEARTHFKGRLEKFYPEAELRAEQQVYVELGLLAPGADMEAQIFSLLEEQAAGYYDPDTDTFFVLDDMPRSAGPVLIVHELTHALDDQYHSIDRLYEQASENGDRAAVMSAVVEGSGTAVMTAYLLREMQAGRMTQDGLRELMESEAGKAERLQTAPAILQRSLLAPYLLGQTLATRGNPLGIASGVKPDDLDRLFTRPPVSTEQLLHPEKYWEPSRDDPPKETRLPDASRSLGEGWSLVSDGVLGELTIALLCGSANPSIDSVKAQDPAAWTNDCAAGWGGDRWQLYRNADRHVVLIATQWDTEADASAFESAMAASGRQPRRRGASVAFATGQGAPADFADAALRSLSGPTPSR